MTCVLAAREWVLFPERLERLTAGRHAHGSNFRVQEGVCVHEVAIPLGDQAVATAALVPKGHSAVPHDVVVNGGVA